jgi:hypothetical protein
MARRRFRRLPSAIPTVAVDGLPAVVLGLLNEGPLETRELLLRTGSEAEALDAALEELEGMGLVGDEAESGPSPPDPADELPAGVMPWSGDDMPAGVVSTFPPAVGTEATSVEAPEIDPSEPVSLREPTPDVLASHRQLYETEFAGKTLDQRVAAAHGARGALLDALCFDPEPPVIAALLENAEIGLDQARLVARHHRNARGLEILTRRFDWLRDGQVGRNLLHNPQLPEGALSRLLGGKRLRDLYKLCVDRELPELTRTRVRGQLRKSFTVAEPDERVEIVMRTEGRALTFLVGCTFDGRSSQMLAAQTFVSSLLVQNLARFSATPPMVLAKLLQQPMVRRQPQLRAMLLRHPNTPSDAKRG